MAVAHLRSLNCTFIAYISCYVTNKSSAQAFKHVKYLNLRGSNNSVVMWVISLFISHHIRKLWCLSPVLQEHMSFRKRLRKRKRRK